MPFGQRTSAANMLSPPPSHRAPDGAGGRPARPASAGSAWRPRAREPSSMVTRSLKPVTPRGARTTMRLSSERSRPETSTPPPAWGTSPPTPRRRASTSSHARRASSDAPRRGSRRRTEHATISRRAEAPRPGRTPTRESRTREPRANPNALPSPSAPHPPGSQTHQDQLPFPAAYSRSRPSSSASPHIAEPRDGVRDGLIPRLVAAESDAPAVGAGACAIFAGRALRPPAARLNLLRSRCFGTCC